ncbi:MAG: UDP-N-acetylmuramate--L-alanine ligase [Candidatus Omnitrophica bacterium]|jgi:UDP-N-acetylmuramate--alanine ligase|nr:UDP-N-acetylmuramate--L-alanine ligase [Candidatus Omnitrophota bacterium]
MDEVLSTIKNIHLIGIGGIGMSGLALLLKEKGFNVRGSDVEGGYITKMLKDCGIEVYLGHKKENLAEDTHLVCYSSAIKENNPEIQEARKRGLSVLQRGKLLGLISWDKKTIAISGSHGKTTTSSLVGFLLTSLGFKPTVFVGGIPLNYKYNAWWGNEYFVIEADESDGSFLYYNPWVSIITNIDYEHLDYYKNIETLKGNFLQFAYQTKELTIGCGDDPFVYEILKKAKGVSYGFGAHNKIRAKDFHYDGEFSCFDFFIDGKFVRQVKIPLLGRHNALNTLAVLSFFNHLNEDTSKVIGALKYFKGTKRRFQIKKKIGDITFVDDYAHHPTEIDAVLKAARYLNPRRLFVIFQPHRFSRVENLYKDFARCFNCADELIVTDIYSASETNHGKVDVKSLSKEIQNNFKGSVVHIPKDKLISEIPSRLKEGDLVMGLGAGDINNIMDGIINELEASRIKA